ncbi:MAG TPA: Crp/Fnr family transcriptional regulator [Bacillota bacterium]|nr:Crp/Fnr family transcriptional regulator [Bacillota bacterium]
MSNLFANIEAIETNPSLAEIFHNCPYRVLKAMEIVDYHAGHLLFQQGNCINCLYIIISGQVEVYYLAENGKKHLKRGVGEGTFLGELELFDQSPSSSCVRALTNVKLFRMKRNTFLKWAEVDNHLNTFLLKQVSKKLYDYTLVTSKNFLYSIKYRICNYFIAYCDDQNKTTHVEIELDKDELSKVFLISERSIDRCLQNLRDLNAIEIRKNSIVVKDVEHLKEIRSDCAREED